MPPRQDLWDDRCVQKWLSRLMPGRQNRNWLSAWSHLYPFFQYLENYTDEDGLIPFQGYTPSMLVEFQENQTTKGQYILLDLGADWVNESGGTINTLEKKLAMVRSFFMHNRAPLPRAKVILRPSRSPIIGLLTRDIIKQVILSSNTRYKAIFTLMFQASLDQEMFQMWNEAPDSFTKLQAQLDKGHDIVKIDLPGRKANKFKLPYYSFFGPDGVKMVNEYLLMRPEDAGAVFVTQMGKPVHYSSLKWYWFRHVEKLGIIKRKKNNDRRNRYGYNMHEMRDVFRSLWSMSPAKGIVGEYCMGHKIDKLEYDKSFRNVEFYVREYRKALPWLNLLSEDPDLIPRAEFEDIQDGQQLQINQLKHELLEMKAMIRGIGEGKRLRDQLEEQLQG